MENNPNMIDSLYTSQNCVQHCTTVGNLVRENRKLFLHKGCYHKFKGYAYSQLHKIKTKKPEGKRAAIVEKFGYDVKFAYHVVRLADECKQILETGTLDLTKNREQMKAVRRGEWTIGQLEKWFTEQEIILEQLYATSTLPYGPKEKTIKALLMQCLEHHYGSISKVIPTENVEAVLNELRSIISKYS